ncbi:hypothetical protein SASPL_146000 [Salvia splendens]|uniref:Shikimate O-hydroxycinnamoyltransferase n=1 Tax=Salvia splendens TaxID=180675 RepID=A0A8X8Z8L5_SALSN|nr:uncharacterized acetyltransferase At3g50280-like [Salvia splendens]KAG6395357.1 hypothetical protein SASPL_146000 [Salvia splendens]
MKIKVSHSFPIKSKCTVTPDQNSILKPLKLSVSDLPMLSCHYIQKGVLLPPPPLPLLPLLQRALSRSLSLFPPLAGRLSTDPAGHVHIHCNDAGADLIHADASHLHVTDLLNSTNGDVPHAVKGLFAFDGAVSYNGHFRPILAVQVTELADGIFIACSVSHAVVDGTSFWNFFNTFAEVCRGAERISKSPDFRRESVLISDAVLRLPEGGFAVDFGNDPIRERIFSFSGESILKLKSTVNNQVNMAEMMGKQSNDKLITNKAAIAEISSFQSLCALLWGAITRARNLPADKTTTFRMAVNCRHRLDPKLEEFYFGNAIQSAATAALAGEVEGKGVRWCAERLNGTVAGHGVREYVEEWEREPRCFPLGNAGGGMVVMGSSPRFPMYENDFGWGRPVAVRSGRNNKFDGKISAFPGREGGGSVDLEVVLAPGAMAGLESDPEFMQYVTLC